jgi:hypothetical protein
MKAKAARRLFSGVVGLSALVTLFFMCVISFAQSPQRGTINGTVTADQGEVRGFRVTAHNLQYRLWYTVFTNKGKYTIPQALPGPYDVTVLELGYKSPTLPVKLGPGGSETLDFAVTKQADEPTRRGRLQDADSPQFEANATKTVWVNSMDELYPPGPAAT